MASSTLSPSHHLLTQHYPKQEGKNEDKGAFSWRGSVFTQRGISCLEAPQRSPNSSRSALLHNMKRRMGSLWLNEANKDPIPWNLTAHCHLNKTKDFEGTGAKKKKKQRLWQEGGFPGASGGKESACNAGDPDLIPGLRQSPGEGIYPLQYSCLENPMDRGAWWATAHRNTKNQTRLSN